MPLNFLCLIKTGLLMDNLWCLFRDTATQLKALFKQRRWERD
jgi:hypothetical protein